MRTICTLNDPKKGQVFSNFLTSEKIENHLEITADTDWGSSNYSDTTCQIWVVDEDQVDMAVRWLEMFQKDPSNPIFLEASPKAMPFIPSENKADLLKLIRLTRPVQPQMPPPLGKITLYMLIICSILFTVSQLTSPAITSYPSAFSPVPLFSAPIKKKLLYDYPQAFEIVDKLVNLYGIDRLQNIEDLPIEGKYLVKQYFNTPYWKGFYDQILSKMHGSSNSNDQVPAHPPAPLFEKVREGEFWRLFTPALLHGDILHIVFNMIWLIMLGKQMEIHLGAWRYLIFIFAAGIFSNTAQYLMGGSNFIGFSGILCAMLTFIWVRQKIAAWEGYQLDGMTMAFMMFFIFSMFAIQLASFYLEANQKNSISPGIANTAHLSGAVFGYILGRLSFFSWKP